LHKNNRYQFISYKNPPRKPLDKPIHLKKSALLHIPSSRIHTLRSPPSRSPRCTHMFSIRIRTPAMRIVGVFHRNRALHNDHPWSNCSSTSEPYTRDLHAILKPATAPHAGTPAAVRMNIQMRLGKAAINCGDKRRMYQPGTPAPRHAPAGRQSHGVMLSRLRPWRRMLARNPAPAPSSGTGIRHVRDHYSDLRALEPSRANRLGNRQKIRSATESRMPSFNVGCVGELESMAVCLHVVLLQFR